MEFGRNEYVVWIFSGTIIEYCMRTMEYRDKLINREFGKIFFYATKIILYQKQCEYRTFFLIVINNPYVCIEKDISINLDTNITIDIFAIKIAIFIY